MILLETAPRRFPIRDVRDLVKKFKDCGLEMKTQRVVFTGAVLSRLFAACAEAEDAFDGVLFGCSSTHAKDVYDDAQEAVSHEESVLMVTNVLTSVSVCSFYDGAGKVNYSELGHLTEQCRDPLIGWCSFSVVPVGQPLLVHKRVTHSLSQHASGVARRVFPPPNLLCLLSLVKEHHEATLSLQYKAYVSTDAKNHPERNIDVMSGRVLVEVPVEILNVGDQRGAGRYASFWPSSFNFLSQTLDETKPMEMISSLEGIGLEPQNQLVNKLLEQCSELLQEYQKNVVHVRNGVQELHKRKEELAELKEQCRN